MKKALIGMSGGVDSSVAAYIIKSEGYQCLGATMKLYAPCEERACGNERDISDARALCEAMGIEHFVFDFSKEFEELVIKKFAREYEAGLTPNPCIDCNKQIKWERMFGEMERLGADYIATGHYARIEFDESHGLYLLKKGLDSGKDQSYVLYNMTQRQLSHTLFPLGDIDKARAREIAEEQGFINSKKKDSQDICFVPDGDYATFIEAFTHKKYPEGDFISKDGSLLGRHKGIIRYTIGQRKGLGLALPKPGYVCRKDMEKNQVIIGDDEDLFTRRLLADEFNWISGAAPKGEIRILAKTRYRHREQPAIARTLEGGRVEVIFDEPQRAITEGQSVVLYDGDILIGGGKICETQFNV